MATTARPIVEELFQQKPLWRRADLAMEVARIHAQRGGQPGKQPTQTIVKKALKVLEKNGKVRRTAYAHWQWTAEPEHHETTPSRTGRSQMTGHGHRPPGIRPVPGTPQYKLPSQDQTKPRPYPLTLDQLRSQTTADQRDLLDSFWQYFLKNTTWPETTAVHRLHHKEKVMQCLRPLSGDIVFETDDSANGRYELTLVGAFLTTEGADYFNMHVAFVEYLRDQFFHGGTEYTQPGAQLVVPDDTVAMALTLDPRHRNTLGRLGSLDWDFRTNTQKDGRWNIHVPKIIENAPETGSLAQFREQLLLRNYNPSKPVFASERQPMHRASVSLTAQTITSPPLPPELTSSLAKFKAEHPHSRKAAFIMMRFAKTKAHNQVLQALRKTLQQHNIIGLRADDKDFHDDLFWNILTYMHGSGFGIAVFERIEQDNFNPNISLEIGYMLALGKPLLLLKDKNMKSLNTDLVGRLHKTFDPQAPEETIAPELARWLKDKSLLH